MPKAIFVRKPWNLGQAISDTAELKKTFHTQPQEYCVAEERELSEIEWKDFTNDLLADQTWITDFVEKGLPCGRVPSCIRVTSPSSEIALIIDPQGCSYARYVAIEEAEELSNREEENEEEEDMYEEDCEETEPITEEEVVDGLRALLTGDSLDCTSLEDCAFTQTYEDGGYLTYDKGFTIHMADGSVFQITVKQER